MDELRKSFKRVTDNFLIFIDDHDRGLVVAFIILVVAIFYFVILN